MSLLLAGESPALALEAQGDDWWAGAQHCFISVARAATALALSTSVAIAGSFNHQDEVPSITATALDEGISWSPPTLIKQPLQIQGPSWDDPSLFWPIEETYEWKVQLTTAPKPQFFIVDEDFVAPFSIDEDFWYWQAPYSITPPIQTSFPVYQPIEEEFPDLTAPSVAFPTFNVSGGGRRWYVIKQKRFFFTNEELTYYIARHLVDLTREDIKVTYKTKPARTVSSNAFTALMAAVTTLEDMSPPVRPLSEIESDDDDDEAIIWLI